ncbi:hypothetical protein N2152v2_006129 [Parachlorella kessleri]
MVHATGQPLLQRTKEQEQRPVVTDGTRSVSVPGSRLVIKYAFLSQRGYYPDAPDKANQDTCCATEQLGGHADQHFFGVFDGHGECGSECAVFAKEKIPHLLAKDKNLATVPEHALHSTMVAVNWQLHRSNIDDSLSGSTACAALVKGSTMYVANVGDSRAVLAEVKAGKLVARDLTWDQTPFREDECERVLKAGARVLTLDQLEGIKDPEVRCWTNEADCDGDPPRLWAPGGVYPGTAFTRSIGDAGKLSPPSCQGSAEDIGVIADPEITIVKLQADQPFAILATDGVWEFISSQKAVDIVSRCSSPYEAAKAVVAAAYKMWLQHETRTDDITCLVLFFSGLESKSKERVSVAASSGHAAAVAAAAHAAGSHAGL